MKPSRLLPILGLPAAGAGLLLAPAATAASAAYCWPPFVLVTGLLVVGYVAGRDGVFEAAAGVLGRVPGGPLTVYSACMALVAAVTVVLNLDTSAAFLTPVLVGVARRRGGVESRFLYGTVLMSNAASLLLPGSNLTNLLILQGEHLTGSQFLLRMLGPWAVAVVVTGLVVAACFRGDPPPRAASPRPRARPGPLSFAAVAVCAGLILALPDAALPVLGVGAGLAGFRLLRGELGFRMLAADLDLAALLGVFGVAVALGAVARLWSWPGDVMAAAAGWEAAVIGALASVLVNNLPAAVLLGSRGPAHPYALLLGLDLGPNLAVTGSLSALIWWRAARSAGARPSALTYSLAGMVAAPLSLGAALLLSSRL